MERRKSKQFDGTDVAEPPDGEGATSAGRDGGSRIPRGLLRREVSRAYTAVASAGDAVAEGSVEALGVLLRLMEEQVIGLLLDVEGNHVLLRCFDWKALCAVSVSLSSFYTMVVECHRPGIARILGA